MRGCAAAASPSISRDAALLLILALAILVQRLHTAAEPLERDAATYAYVAKKLAEGATLYGSVWDHKPPAIYGLFRLAEWLWGYDALAVVWLGVAAAWLSLAGVYVFVASVAGPAAGLAAAVFWTLTSSSVALQANQPNVEALLNVLVIAALCARVAGRASLDARHLTMGAAFAAASLLKLNAVFILGGLGGFEVAAAARRGLRPALRASVALGGPTAAAWLIVLAWFGLQGRLDDAVGAIFVYNARYSESVTANLLAFATTPSRIAGRGLADVWPVMCLALAGLAAPPPSGAPVGRAFHAALLAGSLVAVAAPGKDYPHYHQLVLPQACILGALALHAWAARSATPADRAPRRLAGATLAVAALLAGLQVRYWRMTPDEVSYVKYGMDFIGAREVGRRIAETTAPGEVVYEWGAETNLYLDSRRDAASRYFYLYPLFVGTEPEQRARMDALLDDLERSRPAVFVWNRRYGIPEERLRAWLAERYVAVEKILDFEIYRPRLPDARPPSTAAPSSAASPASETAAPSRNEAGR